MENIFDSLSTDTVVFINEQHNLLDEQKEILDAEFNKFDIVKVPSTGWSLEQMNEVVSILEDMTILQDKKVRVVMLSPIPVMVMKLGALAGFLDYKMDNTDDTSNGGFDIFVFHNDSRDKKELPNGRIIYTVAEKGWVLQSH